MQIWVCVTLVLLCTSLGSRAQVTYTLWQEILPGENDVIPISSACGAQSYGQSCDYTFQTPPGPNDPRWVNTNLVNINYDLIGQSLLIEYNQCLVSAVFAYFQTFINVPANVVPEVTLSVADVDDGVIGILYNSLYPNGLQVMMDVLGNSATVTITSPTLVTGQNRLLLIQVDDCQVSSFVSVDPITGATPIPADPPDPPAPKCLYSVCGSKFH